MLSGTRMKVLLANPRGFCAGVNMAIECLDEVIRRVGSDVFVYHEIVHNRHVVDRFIRQGVRFVDQIDQVPTGGILIFSAHGVSPDIRRAARARSLRTIDATCPLVTKVHLEAIRYASQGYRIILIGHEGHDEVLGTVGEAPDQITLVETPDDVERLTFARTDKLAYLTQTTLSIDDAAAVIEALNRRYPNIESPAKEDICYATTNRQAAVKSLLASADVLIVLGSQNSSNSRRLMEAGVSRGVHSYLVDDARELQMEWFAHAKVVAVTAGASAPETVVEECVDFLKEHFGATVSGQQLQNENVRFALPRELSQQLLAAETTATPSIET